MDEKKIVSVETRTNPPPNDYFKMVATTYEDGSVHLHAETFEPGIEAGRILEVGDTLAEVELSKSLYEQIRKTKDFRRSGFTTRQSRLIVEWMISDARKYT